MNLVGRRINYRSVSSVRDDLLFGVLTGTEMGGQASGVPGMSGFADGSTDRKVHRNIAAHEVGHLIGRHHSVNSVFGFIVENGIRIKVGPCKTFAADSAPDFPMDVFEDDPFQPVLGPMTLGIYRMAYGWDAGFNEYVTPLQTPDLMSYCEFKSDWAWPSLTTHGGLFSGIRGRYGPRAGARAAVAIRGDGPALMVHGEVALDGSTAKLSPLVALPAGINLTDPAPGPFEVQLAWLATDVDSDPLLSTVEYSADNGTTWVPLIGDFSGSSLRFRPINLRELKPENFESLLRTDSIAQRRSRRLQSASRTNRRLWRLKRP